MIRFLIAVACTLVFAAGVSVHAQATIPGTDAPPKGYPFACETTYSASAAWKNHCTALPGAAVEGIGGKFTCYTASSLTCKTYTGTTNTPNDSAGSGGSSANAGATPASDAAACQGKDATYQCVACGTGSSQLPCATSANCNPGTTGACVPFSGSENPTNADASSNTNTSNSNCSGNTLCNPLKVDSIEALVLAVIDVVLIFLLPVIILYIMYAGFLFVKANGNPEGISQAKKALLTALIGGVIVVGARAILDVVKGTVESVVGEGTVSE